MLTLRHVNLNKNWKTKEIETLIRTFSMLYVKSLFKNSKNLRDKTQLQHLLQIQNYIKQNYKIQIPLYNIILNILRNIKLNNKGLLYIKKEQINTIKISEIYRLVTFGNLNVQKNAIFNEAINFGIYQMRMMKKYGY